jgi:hypothetical protein
MIHFMGKKHQMSGVRTAVMDSLQLGLEQKDLIALPAVIIGCHNIIIIKESISFRL